MTLSPTSLNLRIVSRSGVFLRLGLHFLIAARGAQPDDRNHLAAGRNLFLKQRRALGKRCADGNHIAAPAAKLVCKNFRRLRFIATPLGFLANHVRISAFGSLNTGTVLSGRCG